MVKRLEATVGKQCALAGNVEVGGHWGTGGGALGQLVVMRIPGLAGFLALLEDRIQTKKFNKLCSIKMKISCNI